MNYKHGSGYFSDLLEKGNRYIQNTLFKGDAPKLKKGEFHVPQLVWNPLGGIEFHRSAYSGPGSDLQNKAQQNIKPAKNPYTGKYIAQDVSAFKHDRRYELANELQGEEKKKAIRKADQQMVDELTNQVSWKNLIHKPVNVLNSIIGATGIKFKMIGEDLGLVDQYSGSETTKQLDPQYKQLLHKQLKEFENEYGEGHHIIKKIKKVYRKHKIIQKK